MTWQNRILTCRCFFTGWRSMGRITWNIRNWTLERRYSASGSSLACKLLLRMESEGHMELSEYNGWENRFTWLMHLHLSSEQVLMQEVAALVAAISSI